MSYWSPEDASHEGWLSGDFYTEDEVYRSAIPQDRLEEGVESCKPYDLSFPLFAEKGIDKGNFEPKMQTIEATPEFEQGGCAPEVPTDVLFRLEETNIEVSDTTADKLGNQLIDIFSKEYSMHITKTSLRKFSVKAESTNPTWFELKARIYSKGPSHIVEFQRRMGDTVAFNQFFHKVMGLLTTVSNSDQEVGEFIPPQLIHDAASMLPFIDMANNSKDPVLLAEAASGLANAAANQQYALELFAPEAFFAFKTMLRAGGYNVLRPLAHLLSELAMMPKAMPLFADKEFWGALLDVVIAEGICDELKKHFAGVVISALAIAASKEQKDMLKAATKSQGVSEQIRQMLEEAAHTRSGYLRG